ncbi:MAG: A24 family peptidase [Erysipelotrichaceae bacterium]|nr:A24 family peptidase [Erysipelotrichaceae bacterium]
MIFYMLLGLFLSKVVLSIIHYYTLLETSSSYHNDKCFFHYEHCYQSSFWEDFFVSFCNMMLWYLVWFVEGMNIYSFLIGIIASILLTISFIDCKYFFIPDILTFLLFIMGILFICLDYIKIMNAFFGFFSVSSLFYALYIFTKQKGIGGGDIKLMAACGVFLGIEKSIIALEIACLLALFIQGVWKKNKGKMIFAFGPYLSIGILFSFFIEKLVAIFR